MEMLLWVPLLVVVYLIVRRCLHYRRLRTFLATQKRIAKGMVNQEAKLKYGVIRSELIGEGNRLIRKAKRINLGLRVSHLKKSELVHLHWTTEGARMLPHEINDHITTK